MPCSFAYEIKEIHKASMAPLLDSFNDLEKINEIAFSGFNEFSNDLTNTITSSLSGFTDISESFRSALSPGKPLECELSKNDIDQIATGLAKLKKAKKEIHRLLGKPIEALSASKIEEIEYLVEQKQSTGDSLSDAVLKALTCFVVNAFEFFKSLGKSVISLIEKSNIPSIFSSRVTKPLSSPCMSELMERNGQ